MIVKNNPSSQNLSSLFSPHCSPSLQLLQNLGLHYTPQRFNSDYYLGCTVFLCVGHVMSARRQKRSLLLLLHLPWHSDWAENILDAQETLPLLAIRTSCLSCTPHYTSIISFHDYNIPTEVGRTFITNEKAVAHTGSMTFPKPY